MAVYKPKDRETYTYEFQLGGARFRGSTGETSKRKAQEFERRAKDKAKRDTELAERARAAFKGQAPMTISLATARWWNEVGQHHTNSDTSWSNLERIVAWFGAERRLDEITDPDISEWVAARRGETIKGKKTLKDGSPAPLVQPSTVNRSTVEALRKIYSHAREAWKLIIASEPTWKNHRLQEAGEQHAELKAGDQDRIIPALGEGYRDAVMFALASGLRLENCILRWDQIDWEGGRIKVTQKGRRQHTVPLSREMRAILSACKGRDETWVFMFPLRRRSKARRVLGVLYPVTYYGLQIQWRRVAEDLGVDLTFHGLRHTAGTRVTRQTGNLKLAQKLLGHASLATTAGFYAHATEDDLRKALDETPLASPHIAKAQPKNRKKGS
jgi:integrase